MQERAADLATKKDELQKQLAAAKSMRQELQEIKASRGERLCVALAKLSATKDILRTLPVLQTKFTPPQTVARSPGSAREFHQAAPAVPRALGTFHQFLPLAVEQILQPAAPGTPAGGARVITEQYKLQEASRLGCPPDDVCWFLQMHFEVSRGSRLSFSTTLSSTACLASLALNHLATGMQTALFEAMDRGVEGTRLQLICRRCSCPHSLDQVALSIRAVPQSEVIARKGSTVLRAGPRALLINKYGNSLS